MNDQEYEVAINPRHPGQRCHPGHHPDAGSSAVRRRLGSTEAAAADKHALSGQTRFPVVLTTGL